jgi:hypothetical protein
LLRERVFGLNCIDQGFRRLEKEDHERFLEPFLRSHKGKQLGQKIKGMF